MNGTFIGVGVGPGDPELLTLKAIRVIETASLVAFPANRKGYSRARQIVAAWLGSQRELPMPMHFDLDRADAKRAYGEAARAIRQTLAQGLDVAALCEGDPLFYGSFIHLREAIGRDVPCRVVPGICSVHAAAASSLSPLGTGDAAIVVVPGTAPTERIEAALREYDTVAILKPGRHRQRILDALDSSGRIGETVYVEAATQNGERIVRDPSTLGGAPGPYFALFLVTGNVSP